MSAMLRIIKTDNEKQGEQPGRQAKKMGNWLYLTFWSERTNITRAKLHVGQKKPSSFEHGHGKSLCWEATKRNRGVSLPRVRKEGGEQGKAWRLPKSTCSPYQTGEDFPENSIR